MKLHRTQFHDWQLVTGTLLVILLSIAGCDQSSTSESATSEPSPVPTTASPTSSPTPPPSTKTSISTPTPIPTSTPRPTSTSTPTPWPTPTPTPSLEELAAQYPELAAVLNDPEISTTYKELLLAYQEGGEQAALDLARQHGVLTPEGNIRATLTLDTEDTANVVTQLEAAGVTVTGTDGNRIDTIVPMELIRAQTDQPGAIFSQLSRLEHVTGVRPPW